MGTTGGGWSAPPGGGDDKQWQTDAPSAGNDWNKMSDKQFEKTASSNGNAWGDDAGGNTFSGNDWNANGKSDKKHDNGTNGWGSFESNKGTGFSNREGTKNVASCPLSVSSLEAEREAHNISRGRHAFYEQHFRKDQPNNKPVLSYDGDSGKRLYPALTKHTLIKGKQDDTIRHQVQPGMGRAASCFPDLPQLLSAAFLSDFESQALDEASPQTLLSFFFSSFLSLSPLVFATQV